MFWTKIVKNSFSSLYICGCSSSLNHVDWIILVYSKGYTFLHRRFQGQNSVFQWKIQLKDKLLGNFPRETGLEVTIHAWILVDWLFQVKCPENEWKKLITIERKFLAAKQNLRILLSSWPNYDTFYLPRVKSGRVLTTGHISSLILSHQHELLQRAQLLNGLFEKINNTLDCV